jgi:hypothetical protein
MNCIFTARMACVSRGGSSPLLIAVFEGGHFPVRTLPTRSKGILVAVLCTRIIIMIIENGTVINFAIAELCISP